MSRGSIGWLRAMALLAVLALVAACGGSTTETTAASGDGSSASDDTSTPDDTEPAGDPVEIRYLQPSSSLAYMPFEIADSLGLFEEAGITIEHLPDNAQGSQALLSGEVDIAAVSTPQLFNAMAEGRPLKSVAVMTPNSTNDLVLTNETIDELAAQGITRESPIEERIQALEGMTITLPAEGSSSNLSMRSVLREYGLDPDSDVELIALSDSSAHVATSREGQANGYMFSPPVTSIAITEGFGQLWFGFYEGDIPLISNFSLIQVATTPEFIESNPEAVNAFVEVMAQTIESLESDPEGVAEALKEEWFADLDQETFDMAFETMQEVYTTVIPDQESFEKTRSLVEQQVERELDLSFEDVYDMAAIEALDN